MTTTITPELLAELWGLAEAATPGPWSTILPGGPQGPFWALMNSERGWIVATQVGFEREPANAAYIAASNPAVMIALIDKIERLEKRCAQMAEVNNYWTSVAWQRMEEAQP